MCHPCGSSLRFLLALSPSGFLSPLWLVAALSLARSRSLSTHCRSSSSIKFAARMILLFFCSCNFKFRLISFRSCFTFSLWAFSRSTSCRMTFAFSVYCSELRSWMACASQWLTKESLFEPHSCSKVGIKVLSPGCVCNWVLCFACRAC